MLENLPKAVLAAVVLTAVSGLVDFPALFRMWRVSRLDFYASAIALVGVLFLGILQGILLAALASILMLLIRASRPHVAFLGRIPGTNSYSDLSRHPENETLPSVIAFRPEASLIYVNADLVRESVLNRLRAVGPSEIRLMVCDLSASPYLDLAGSRMGKRGKFPGERRWIYAGAGRMRLARGGIFGPGMPRRAPMNS